MDLKGATLELEGSDGAHPFEGSSLLGRYYLAGLSHENIVVGATKEYGFHPEEAFSELRLNMEQSWTDEYKTRIEAHIHEEGIKIWRPLEKWKPVRIRTGVRALPPMTQLGALPLLRFQKPNYWVISGLGSRGVLYHAWLGSQIAKSILYVMKHPSNDVSAFLHPPLWTIG